MRREIPIKNFYQVTIAATIVLLLGFGLVETGGALPRSPGSHTADAIEGWCNEQGGNFTIDSYGEAGACYSCGFKSGAGGSDIYTCCQTASSTTCSWYHCGDVCSEITRGQFELVIPIFETLKLQKEAIGKLDGIFTQADLVPLPKPASVPPEGFCSRNDQGKLLVNIYNQGVGDAAASKTRVIFGSADPADFDTPAIAAGTGTQLVITIPDACFDPNTQKCSFTIGVDATNAVLESNEINNNASGLCGPQFQ